MNPIKYRIEQSPLMNYGSSQNGNCSNTSVTMDGGQVCTTPQSSVLFDGVIPSLTGRNNSTCWASQLLVLNLSTTITFEFSDPSSGIKAFGIVMLNCDQENIGAAGKVMLQEEGGRTLRIAIDHMSCNHLIRVCGIFIAITTNTITLSFEVSTTSQFPLAYYIAEVSFYDYTLDCPSSGTINTSASSTTSGCMNLEPGNTVSKWIETFSPKGVWQRKNVKNLSCPQALATSALTTELRQPITSKTLTFYLYTVE